LAALPAPVVPDLASMMMSWCWISSASSSGISGSCGPQNQQNQDNIVIETQKTDHIVIHTRRNTKSAIAMRH
jgi:hypothetical protein